MQSPGSATWFQPEVTKHYVIEVHNNHKFVVGILEDGSVEYGEGFTADTAAKEFWQAVGSAFPNILLDTQGDL